MPESMNQHWWINVCYDFLHHLGSYRNTGQFQISSRRENRQRHTWIIKCHQEFLEKFSANIFALSDAEDSTYRPLNRAGIADLPLLRTLLAICQKSWEPSVWKVMDSFVLLPCASLAASKTLLQRLIACLNFTLD